MIRAAVPCCSYSPFCAQNRRAPRPQERREALLRSPELAFRHVRDYEWPAGVLEGALGTLRAAEAGTRREARQPAGVGAAANGDGNGNVGGPQGAGPAAAAANGDGEGKENGGAAGGAGAAGAAAAAQRWWAGRGARPFCATRWHSDVVRAQLGLVANQLADEALLMQVRRGCSWRTLAGRGPCC